MDNSELKMDHVISGEIDCSEQNGHATNLHSPASETIAPRAEYTQNGDVIPNESDIHESLMTFDHVEENNDIIFVRRGAISIENIHKVTKAKDSGGFCENLTRIKIKITNDKLYRDKFWYSVSLIGSFFVLGWLLGQVGPSLLDLQKITGVSMEKASFYVTACCAGYMTGSVIGGFSYSKFNKCLLMFTYLCALAASVITLPWCVTFETMLLVQFVQGMFQGSIDTVTCAEMVAIWDTKTGQSFMQGLHFGFSLGGIVSPLITAPFLASEDDVHPGNYVQTFAPEVNNSNISPTHFNSSLEDIFLLSYSPYINDTYNRTQEGLTSPTSSFGVDAIRVEEKSLLFIAYSISGVVSLLIASLFLVIYCKTGGKFEHHEKRKRKEESRDLSSLLKVVIIITMSCMSMLYTGLEETFVEFLSVFVVKKIEWTKTLGSIATSLYFGSIGVGHFINIFIVRVCDPVKLMGVNCFVLVLVMVGLLISSSKYFHIGVWLSCPLIGICLSVIYPIIFTWTEDAFMPVTGRISSIFILTGALGSLVNPIILGLLMEDYTPMWFCYLLLIESILQFVFYIIGLLLSKVVRTKYEGAINVNV